MIRKTGCAVILSILLPWAAATGRGQSIGQRPSLGRACSYAGAYRINVAESDRLYSVVRGATSSVPFGEQQRFFIDLSVRLTPPDILAIECGGTRVSIGSSRSPKVTFAADGATRNERSPGGSLIRSRVEMRPDTLTFTSTGKAADSVNVVFKSLDGGRRLEVTRRIYAEQLTEPVVIRTVYNRISADVEWNKSGDIAGLPPERSSGGERLMPGARSLAGNDEAAKLRGSLDDWIGATNGRDIENQMTFYAPRLDAYYLTRNTPREAVRSEKRRVFSTAKSIDIRADDPEIIFQDSGRTAVMRFRKKYRVADKKKIRSGEVVQELRWRRTNDGWRIYSERDVKVIR